MFWTFPLRFLPSLSSVQPSVRATLLSVPAVLWAQWRNSLSGGFIAIASSRRSSITRRIVPKRATCSCKVAKTCLMLVAMKFLVVLGVGVGGMADRCSPSLRSE